MFGRKQSAFTLDHWKREEHLDSPYAQEPGPLHAPQSPHVPPAPPAHLAQEPVARTPRPDPATYLAEKAALEAAPAGQDASLLQLESAAAVGAPKATGPAPRNKSGRAKTRLLGFENANPALEDAIAKQDKQKAWAPMTYQAVGWLVVISGPGRGHSMPIRTGVSQIGRGDDQAVQLDFGDTSISRENHASVAFDPENRTFFIGHGGKANLVRLNGAPVLTTQELEDGDKIRIGETTLQLVAFCGADFSWEDADPEADTTEIPAVAEEAVEPEPEELPSAVGRGDVMEFQTPQRSEGAA